MALALNMGPRPGVWSEYFAVAQLGDKASSFVSLLT
jgi:hypothetical protein